MMEKYEEAYRDQEKVETDTAEEAIKRAKRFLLSNFDTE